MINHEFIIGRSRTNFLEYTLQINTTSIERADLITLINYLIDHVHVIYDKYPEQEEDVMWPIVIKLNNQVVITESILWKFMFDTFTDGYSYLEKYINRLMELAKNTEFELLLQSNEYQFHGGLAFNQYWLWCTEGPHLKMELLTQSINLYSLWLSKNDLDFETNQNDWISIIFERYKQVNQQAIATMLAQRLNNGQLREKKFDYLANAMIRYGKNSRCLLKEVINQLLNKKLHLAGTCCDESLFLELCAVFYGNEAACTSTVMSYVRDKANIELNKLAAFEVNRIKQLRYISDNFWQNVTSQERYIDTSFHLFDTHTRKWIDYDERE